MWGKRTQRGFDQLIKQLKEDKFEYTPKEDKEIDWSKYDKAQINEINDMLLMIKKAVDTAYQRLDLEVEEKNGPGRPSNDSDDLAKTVLMQQYFGVSNRVAEGLVLLFKEKLELKDTFSYKTIERAYENPEVTLILKEVFRMSQEPIKNREHIFSPDGTGFSTSMKQNWENDRRKDRKSKGYEKAMAMMGNRYKILSAFELAKNPHDNESPYFEPLLAETAAHYDQIDLVSADAAYLSRHNCNLVDEVGAIPRIYPMQGVTLKMRGSSTWTDMLLSFIQEPQEWLRDYHTRSISESVFSAFKRDFPLPLRRRIKRRRKQEAFARICDYNLKRLCYLKYLEKLSTEVWNT